MSKALHRSHTLVSKSTFSALGSDATATPDLSQPRLGLLYLKL